MGSGTFYAVGFGCPELPELEDDSPLHAIFDEHDIKTSYEGARNYVVIILLTTLSRGDDDALPWDVLPIEDLADAISRQIGGPAIARARRTWQAVQKAAAELPDPITLPAGQLLWLRDYD